MNFKIVSANEWLFPGDSYLVLTNNRFRIPCARGSYAACQIYIADAPIGKPINYRFKAEPMADGSIIPNLFRLLDVKVEVNTGHVSYALMDGECAGSYITRSAPFKVYDAMKPIDDDFMTHSKGEAFYVRFRILKKTVPGIYKFGLQIEIGDRNCEAEIEVEVFKVEIPEEESLKISNWFSLANTAERHRLDPWSEAHWEMIRQYAMLMRHVRQTHFLVPIELVDFQKTENCSYCFSFDRVKKFISLFLDLGFKVIEGGHLAMQLQLGDPYFMLKADKSIRAASLEGYQFISHYLKAWHSLLKENNWLEKTVQHVADEPFDASSEEYRTLADIVRKYMPGITIIEAVCTYKVDGAVDIIIPTNQDYEEHSDKYEAFRRQGGGIWFYTCSVPGGHYMNRLMDIPLLKTRLIHWGNFLYKLDGYLHWGFNCYRPDQNPFESNCPVHTALKERKRLPAGDTHIVYPGSRGPLGSVRLEAMRAGIEDYELLAMLEKKDKVMADEILLSSMKSFSDSISSSGEFYSIYRRLLASLS